MNIMILSQFYPPYYVNGQHIKNVGGAVGYAEKLAKELAKKHKVVVCCINSGQQPETEWHDGVKVYRLRGFFFRLTFLYGDPSRRFHPPLADPWLARRLFEIAGVEKPDVIHANDWSVFSAFTLKTKLGIPVVVTLHDYGFICPTKVMLTPRGKVCTTPGQNCLPCSRQNYGLAKAAAVEFCLKKSRSKIQMVDKFIAVSSSVKEIYRQFFNLPEEKFEVVYNFYAPDEQVEKVNSDILFSDDFILFVGTLAPYKGVDVLLAAYRQLRTDVKLVLIGMKQAGYHYEGDERIIILENQPHHVVMEAWRRCRFGVVPSVCPEACPTVALEAMASGKALVASNIGGLKDIVVHGETGLLVSPGDAEALASAMEELIAEPEMAVEMGKKGRKRLEERFSLALVVEDIERLYGSLKEHV